MSRPSVLDIASIQEITNPTEVAKLLNEVIQEERAVDAQLEQMLQKRDSFEELLQTTVRETDDVKITLEDLLRLRKLF